MYFAKELHISGSPLQKGMLMCKETPCQTEVVIPHRSDLHWGILISQLFQGSHRVQTVMEVFPDLCIVKNRQSLNKFVKWKTFYVKMKMGLKYFWKSNHFSLSALILEYKFWDKERKFINYLNVRFYFCLSLTRKSILKVLDEHLCNFFSRIFASVTENVEYFSHSFILLRFYIQISNCWNDTWFFGSMCLAFQSSFPVPVEVFHVTKPNLQTCKIMIINVILFSHSFFALASSSL